MNEEQNTMWGKKKPNPKQAASGRFDTLISNKTQITGDIQFSGGLHIDGRVTGTIRAEDDSNSVVRISDLGVVEGDVVAPHVIVNGRVNGDVYSSKHIELAAKASVQGNVFYNLIEMTMGAEVNGKLVHSKETPVQAKATTTASKPEAMAEAADNRVAKASPETQPNVIGLNTTLAGKG